MMKSMYAYKNQTLIIFSISVLYLISRILFLDSDVPAWDISFYQPIDEFYYSLGAFNLFREGSYNFTSFDFINEPTFVTNYFTEYLTYLSLSLFGNNYYGLRLASVFAGFLIVLLLNKIFFLYQKSHKVDSNIWIYLTLYMIVDFSFMLSNRVLEPTIFRMLSMLFVIYISIKLTKEFIDIKRSIFLGFISFSSFIYVYTTNLFIIPALGLYILIISYLQNPKDVIKIVVAYIFGVLISVLLFILYYYLVFDGNYIVDFMEMMSVMNGRISHFFMNIFKFFNTNIFKYNQLLLFLTMFIAPLFIYITIKLKNKIDILFLSFLSLFIAQNIFINDYYDRKLIMLYPFVLYMIASTYINKNLILSKISTIKFKWVSIYLILLFLISSFFNSLPRSHSDVHILNYIISLYLLVYLILYLKQIKNKYLNILLIISIFSTNIIMDIKYIFLNPTYHYKNCMIQISKEINNSYTIGSSHAFRLYNSSKPLMSNYVYMYFTPKDEYEKDKNQLIRENNKIYELKLVDTNISNKKNTYKFSDSENKLLKVIKYERL